KKDKSPESTAENLSPVRPPVSDLPPTARFDHWMKSPAAEFSTTAPETLPADDSRVRTIAIGTPDRGEVAFAMQLEPANHPVGAERERKQAEVERPDRAQMPEAQAYPGAPAPKIPAHWVPAGTPRQEAAVDRQDVAEAAAIRPQDSIKSESKPEIQTGAAREI